MNTKTKLPANQPSNETPDPAAVFAAAQSLWAACQKQARHDSTLNFSEHYHGMDEFMRVVMRVANRFERWSCRNLNFAELDQPWPYLLQDRFGEACLQVVAPAELTAFTDNDCLRIAIKLCLPVRLDLGLPVPVDISASNPLRSLRSFVANESAFCEFRIQTVREELADHDCAPFTAADDPFDPDFGPPYYGLYGVGEDGLPEHIADRQTYAEALALAQKLAPGIIFTAKNA
jgi:hypothetical protein